MQFGEELLGPAFIFIRVKSLCGGFRVEDVVFIGGGMHEVAMNGREH